MFLVMSLFLVGGLERRGRFTLRQDEDDEGAGDEVSIERIQQQAGGCYGQKGVCDEMTSEQGRGAMGHGPWANGVSECVRCRLGDDVRIRGRRDEADPRHRLRRRRHCRATAAAAAADGGGGGWVMVAKSVSLFGVRSLWDYLPTIDVHVEQEDDAWAEGTVTYPGRLASIEPLVHGPVRVQVSINLGLSVSHV